MLNQLIVIPFINVLTILYSLIPGNDFGLAVIAFTIMVRIILWPFASKALHGQKAVQEIQPEIEKLKKRYKDKTEFNKAVMELYKEKEVNPFGSCLPTLIQFPFLIGMFYVFMKFRDPNFVNLSDPNSGILSLLYDYVKNISFVKSTLSSQEAVSTTFLGIVNLAKPSIFIALAAAIAQFFQTKMLTPKKNLNEQQKMMGKFTYLFPAVTFIFGVTFPAALPLYWLTQSLFAITQQYIIMHKDVNFLENIKSKLKPNGKDKA